MNTVKWLRFVDQVFAVFEYVHSVLQKFMPVIVFGMLMILSETTGFLPGLIVMFGMGGALTKTLGVRRFRR